MDIESKIDSDLYTFIAEDSYMGKDSGFSLQSIADLLLDVYKYTPMGGLSYIPLPIDITNKKNLHTFSKYRSTVF